MKDREVAIRNGLEAFEFFGFALGSLDGFGEHKPGRTNLWENFQKMPSAGLGDGATDYRQALSDRAGDIGTPEDMRQYLRKFAAVGVDQVTFIQQAGNNQHADICHSLELFAREVMLEFEANEAKRERCKAEELAPHIAAALALKQFMKPPVDADIPIFPAQGRKISEENKNAKTPIYEKSGTAG